MEVRGIATRAPAVPRKSERFGSVLIGFENKKMAGTEENIGRFLEILRSSKITLDNFLSVPPLLSSELSFDQKIFFVCLNIKLELSIFELQSLSFD